MLDHIDNVPPKQRPANQQWIFFMWESPITFPRDFIKYKEFYNLTMTYKTDSNFSSVYEIQSGMQWSLNETWNEDFDFYSNKTKFAAAVISNCGHNSQRLELIDKLRAFIDVDIFGKCGKPCPTHYKNTAYGCKKILSKEYKFYFSFENSVCTGYITEKFFEILKYNIIPVVLGGGNYDKYVSINLV